ncbi:MAG TPA: NAD+ synthase [Bacteroidia bacterium]|nr:NAD+ synthase [Bacteroidia bacterium]
MKIALAQLDFHIGNFENNTGKIIDFIGQAKRAGADLVVFPEMAVSGYPPLDFLDYTHFTRSCEKAVSEIANVCTGIHAIVGSPSVNPVLKGKNLFNSAFLLGDGKILDVFHKSLLPTYDVFDEYRYFEPGKKAGIATVAGVKVAITICEDLWNEEDDPLYVFCPLDEVIGERPQLIINIAASPFDYQHEHKRKAILRRNVNKYKLPLVYVNHVGAHTDLIFDGGSLVMNAQGSIVLEAPVFQEALMYADPLTIKPEIEIKEKSKFEKIHLALICGIRDYFGKLGFQKATLGLSGGVDSALVLALASEALGPENVFPVMLPSPYSSDHSISDSLQLIKNLGNPVEEIAISEIYEAFLKATRSVFNGIPFNVAEENMQARIRGTLLMAVSNKLGYILLNTSNKSELAVGYGTLYGDMCGGLSVIGDLYKTDVYALCRYINRENEIIPKEILDKAPSAELRPGQKDSDSLPPYEQLDAVLFQYIENQKGPDEILQQGFDESLVSRTLKLVNKNEYKRFQFAPILRVSPKAFGRGRRMPLVARYLS